MPEAVVEAVERLMFFIQPDARDTVRSQVLGLIHEYRIQDASSGDRPD